MELRQTARRVVLSLCLAVGSSISYGGTVVAQAAGPDGDHQSITAEAAPVGGNDYPWQSASMDAMSPLRFAFRNCTDYVAFKLNQQLGGSLHDIRFDWSSINIGGNGHASAWKAGAAGKYMVDHQPQLGSVAWWGYGTAGGYGHVALVAAVSPDGNAVTLHEYNTAFNGQFQYQPRTVNRGEAGWPEAFIHVADRYADGTILQTEQGETYVVAGGAALPVRAELAAGLEELPVAVTRHQIQTMPSVPRDDTYLRDMGSSIDYVVRQGSYYTLTAPGVGHSLWGQDLGTWAAGYLSPELGGGAPPESQRPAGIKADVAGMGVSGRPLSGKLAVQ